MAGDAASNAEGYSKMMSGLRDVFDTGRTLPLSFRLNQLDRFFDMVNDNFEEMLVASSKDMRKARFEAASYELEILKCEIKKVKKGLKSWEQREWMPFNILIPFDSACIKRDPYGVVLVVGPWNYPYLLPLQPLIGAIAAGNVAVIKPSEHSPNVAAKIAELIPKYLDQECYKVILGGAPETIQLLEQKFDYIFATSSTCIGKSIMQAAAKHLTPVTLELGGKSPVYIDENSDLEMAAKRILWGKCINLGQTCIAPDYILCSKKVQAVFVEAAKKYLKEWYGEDPKSSSDLTRIVNSNHFKRLSKLMDGTKGKIVLGGDRDSDDLYIAPTLVVDVKEEDILMQDEIFGPILPFVTISSKEEALRFIKMRPKPLALYVFSKSNATLDYFIDNCSSGAVCCNDVVVQNAWEGLAFGGVGDSGIGRYHGRYSYETFTHEKSVVIRGFSSTGEAMSAVRYPPYNSRNMRIIATFMRHFSKFNIPKSKPLAYLMSFVVGVASAMVVGTKWVVDKKRGL